MLMASRSFNNPRKALQLSLKHRLMHSYTANTHRTCFYQPVQSHTHQPVSVSLCLPLSLSHTKTYTHCHRVVVDTSSLAMVGFVMITNLILHNLSSVTEKTVLSGIVVIMGREINKANPKATFVIFIVIIVIIEARGLCLVWVYGNIC